MEIDWGYVFWGTIIFVGSSAASLIFVTIVVVALPSTYFLDRPTRQLWVDHHPAVRISMVVLKNLLGALLVASGGLLSVPGIPGQGMLIIMVGILLLDFPGKHRWERRFISRPRILTTINRIRETFGKAPLQVTETESANPIRKP